MIGAPRLRSGQPQQGALRHLAAVHARRSEEDDGVLDVLLAESSERAEVLGEDANRSGVGAFEKLSIVIRERLLGWHVGNRSIYGSANQGRVAWRIARVTL